MFYKPSKVAIFPQVIKSLAVTAMLGALTACGASSGDNGEPLLTNSNNKLPSVNAGPDQTVKVQSNITLSGSGSDSDGSIVSYQWTQTSGKTVSIENPNRPDISFRAPKGITEQQITLQLTVTDNEGATNTDSLIITVVPMTPEEAGLALRKALKNAGYLAKVVTLPPKPDRELAIVTVEGIDTNNNGTRDDLEHITYQGLNMLKGVNLDTYNHMISIINMIQPPAKAVENSISKIAIYCSYQSLPENVKEKMPLRFVYMLVLNTQPRKTAHARSVMSAPRDLGPELCEPV
ncbi:PKD domain-containing protein [Pseudoalteromonas spongiae]|uniref:PKD domain-containing protein n=1 Tax=Pseudoalteromonas spongiae TaxID=298657 RepID=A0ABU8EYW8_9GAMM